MDRIFRPSGSFTDMGLLWLSVIFRHLLLWPLIDQIKADMKHKVTSLKKMEVETKIRQTEP